MLCREKCNRLFVMFFFFKQKTAYDMRISDWSSDVCSSDLGPNGIGLSPDGSTLYVAETYSAHLWRFRLTAPGVIDRTAGMDAHGGTLVGRGGPGQFLDSLAVARGGYIFVASTGRGAVLGFSPEGGPPEGSAMPDFLTTKILFWGPYL